jgi:thiol-disulfide isomerase/thioredoxin
MKRLLIICAVVFTFISCQEEQKIDYVFFSGEILNPNAKIASIYKGNDLIKDFIVKPDGTFSDTLRVKAGYYNLEHGDEFTDLYLESGNNIKVSFNTNQFDETIAYSGKGSKNNNYLAKKILADKNSNFDYKEIFSMDETNFIAIMDEVKSSKLGLINDVKNISTDFKTFEIKNIEYEYLSNLQNYKSAHSFYSKKEDFKPSENFLKILEDIDYNNQENYANIENYKSLVQKHYISMLSNSDNPSDVFKDIIQLAFPELKKDLSESLRFYISPNNAYNKVYYDGIMAMSQADEKFRDDLTYKYHKVRKLAKGMPSPQFVDYKNHNGSLTSLKDLEGKYIYIDVWATWCGPCIAEIPSLKQVEEEFKGKNITFVSLSIDTANDHKAWVEMVKDKELGGIQLMADKDWNSKFVKDYAIEGIPRFILIDPSGNIFNAEAPRPSNPKLVNMLQELNL